MKIQNVISATLNETENPFTLEQLHCLADTSAGVPIFVNFGTKDLPVGTVVSAEVKNECLVLFVDLQENYCKNNFYIVPGYKTSKYEIFAYGLTLCPMDTTLAPLIF